MFKRKIVSELVSRLEEERRFIQIVSGPRQTGKTTAISQALEILKKRNPRLKTLFASAAPGPESMPSWLQEIWNRARPTAKGQEAILVGDEIQMIQQWSSYVKALYDEDTHYNVNLKVVLSGSSSLLLQRGLREGLTGRFELLRNLQWNLEECQKAFGASLNQYLTRGGYPGAYAFLNDETRWKSYMQDAVIMPSIFRDVVAIEPVSAPALMESLFFIGAAYSGQEMSFRKILGQLNDAGNVTLLANYLSLLEDAGLLAGLKKYTGKLFSKRSSSPRFMVFDTALMVATGDFSWKQYLEDPALKGHLVESAVGAFLLKKSLQYHFDLNWWRDRDKEVDFVVSAPQILKAIEVKSSSVRDIKGITAFHEKFPKSTSQIVGSQELPLEKFLKEENPLL